ncbi:MULTISPECIES: carbohydrate ABC transporter permease [Caloramator]|uniref:Binding-protein-dependent transport systems inner membrane component n=1 Tax=Caloramator australicus RC3 TaxID=857293 RepID=I7K534_9CLOT|nr:MULTISPECIES: sugar ABC transporter permease [Caloramator]MDO6355874.1 sugar ABC transporter permease [Caloramator sp. CAR-1]CCJ32674.1 binding-protein-dependent transport systems inner membrane component [Caloramator australicus RC3]
MNKNLQKIEPYLFILPQFIFFIVFMILPTGLGIWISLNKWDYLTKPKFVGLKNYIDLFKPDTIDYLEFWNAFGNTFKFVIFSVPPLIIIALALALLVNSPNLKFRNFFRGVFYASNVLSVSCVGLIWLWMLDTNAGLVNYYLEKLGIGRIPWLAELPWAWISLVAMTVWWIIGGNMILFLAGLQDIPQTLYEAADIDGASGWQKFWYVTLPGLKRPLLFIVIMTTLAQFNIFGQPYMVTRGGPGNATKVLLMYIRDVAFGQYRMGSASAMAIMMGLVMIVFSIIQYKLLSPKE